MGAFDGHGRDSDAWPALVLDSLPHAVVTVDIHGLVTAANGAAATVIGRAVSELVGTDLRGVLGLLDEVDRRPAPGKGEVPACLDVATSSWVRAGWVHGSGPAQITSTCLVRKERVVGAVVCVAVSGSYDDDRHQEVLRLTERERAQREFLHQLQESVRPRQPAVAGVELGVHYLAADPDAPSGGDLYDWQVLPDGDLHLAVVDVIGSGVSATKDALAVIHAARVLVLEGCPMDRLVARIDSLLTETQPSLVATLLVGRYTPSTGRMVLAGGGHPPMLIVSPDGAVREVSAPGIAIGWPEAGSFEVTEVELARSETAVFYTDGLVEARRDILTGLADLKAAAAETVTYPTRHLPRVLVERALAGAERRDDTLALVVRRRCPPPGPRPRLLGPFEHRFSPSMASVVVARHLFSDWLRFQQVEEGEVDDLLVVVSELCTNAVRVASGAHVGIALRAWAEGTDLVVEVCDDGQGFAVAVPAVDELPGVEQQSGRGLFLVQSMVDDFEVRDATKPADAVEIAAPVGTVVRCVKRYLFAEAAPASSPPS